MSSIVQAKAEAQKLIKRYNQLQAEARTADAEEAARKATEAEKLVSQISALQTAISKLQARDKEAKEKEAKESIAATTAPSVKKSTPSTLTTAAKKPEMPEEALEDLKRAEAEKSALELRINRIEAAQRRTREQIDQLARAKQELAKLKSQAEQSVKDRRANDEKLQEELTRRIEQKEREQQRLKDELEAARHKAEKDAELLKAQRDAARALIEKQQQLEREKLLATRRSSGSGKGILIGLSISIFSVIALGAAIWFTPILDSVEIVARLKTPVPTNNTVAVRPAPTQQQQPPAPSAQTTAPAEPKPVVPRDPPRALEVYQDNLARGGLGPVMIKLSDGTFTMGAKASSPFQDELPPHEVRLQSFSISRFEITFEEFDAFAESTGLALPKDKGWGRGKQPVINITWEEAVDYTKWLSQQTGHQYRLPSEREWEYAAGAGKDSLYWYGNELGRNRGNCAVCGSQWDNNQPAPVGSFQPNPLGLNDTIGNVLEWTVDCFRSNYIGSPITGNLWQGGDEDCSHRMARSGSFRSYENALRTTKRNNYSPRTRLDNLGFRVVRVD